MEGANTSGQNLQTSDLLLDSKLSVSLGAEFNSIYPQSTVPIKIQSRVHHLNVLVHEILKFKLQTLQFTEMVLWCQENLQSRADFFNNFSMYQVPFFENFDETSILKRNQLFISSIEESVQRQCIELRNLYKSNPNQFSDLLQKIVDGLKTTSVKEQKNVVVEKNNSDFGKLFEFELSLKTLCSPQSKHDLSTKEYLLISYIFQINIAIYSMKCDEVYLNNILLNGNDKDIDLCIFQQQVGNQVTIQICGKTEIQQLQSRLKMSLDLYESYLIAALPEVKLNQKKTNFIQVESKQEETKEKNQQDLNSQQDSRTQETRTPTEIPLKTLQKVQVFPVFQKPKNQQKPKNYKKPDVVALLFTQNKVQFSMVKEQSSTVVVETETEKKPNSNAQAQVENTKPQRVSVNKQQLRIVKIEECKVCGEAINNGKRLQNCDHLAHFECLKTHVQTIYKEGKRHLDKFTCYEFENGKTCGKQIQEPLLKSILTASQYHEVCMNSSDIGNRYCPYQNCGLPMEVDLRTTGNPGIKQKYDCPACRQPICKICFKKYHGENQNNQPCPVVIDEIRQGIGNEAVAVCPVCEILYLKDDHCDRVECQKCKMELCFACSCPRYPTMVHGNHYHRKGCPSYAEYGGNEGIHPKCEHCQKSGKVCEPPISLAEYKQKHLKYFKK